MSRYRPRLTVFARALQRAFKIDAHTRQDGRCLYCHDPLKLRASTVEHATPRSRGGSNHRSNIDAACHRCNQVKGSRTRAEFMRCIHEPDMARDSWPLYLACMDIRISRRIALAVKRLGACA